MTESWVVVAFDMASWLLSGVLAVWRLSVLANPASRTRGRITVAVLFSLLFLSSTLLIEPVTRWADATAPGLARLVFDMITVWVACGLVHLLGDALESRPRWVPSTRVQAVLGAGATVGLAAVWAAGPRDLTGLGTILTPGPPGPFVFGLIYCAALGQALLAAARLAVVGSRNSPGRWRSGLAICAAGLTLAGSVMVVRLPLIALAASGVALPAWGEPLLHVLVSIGRFVMFAGLFLVAAESALAETRLWWRAKRDTIALRSLWTELHAVFPQIALHPPRGLVREAAAIRWVSYSHRRRVVECRDGLWLLSRHAEAGTGVDTVRAALTRARRGDEGTAAPRPLLSGPDEEGSLLALSRALTDREPPGNPPSVLSPITRTGT